MHSTQLQAGIRLALSECLMGVYASVNQQHKTQSVLYLLATCCAIKRLLIQAQKEKSRDFGCETSIIQKYIHYSKFFLKSHCQFEREKKMSF